MCHNAEKISLLLLGLGLGLLLSLLLPGWFLRVVVAIGLIAIGLVVSNCR